MTDFMNTPRTLIIGLDGATFDLIKPWSELGYLPTFKKIMAQGAYGPLQVWPNMNSASAWSSMVTGYNSGQHGIFDFSEASSQRGVVFRPFTGADCKKDPFWRILSASGKRVGIVNVPITYPADPVNGFMLSGMDAPGLNSPGFSFPPHLCDELRQKGIDYILDIPNLATLSKRSPKRVLRMVQKMVDSRCRGTLYLMKAYPWDVMMAVFVALDRVQHYFWPSHNPSFQDPAWEPIRHLYQKLDSFLGEILASMGNDTTLMLVSDHGFGPETPAKFSVNQLFAQLGLLRFRQSTSSLKGTLLKHLLLYGRQVIPSRLQYPLARAFPRLHRHAASETMYPDVDWPRTQAFAAFHVGYVTINLKGRQPEGTVSPEDYHSLRERIKEILLALTDEKTGDPVILSVYRREELYRGPYVDRAGDLIIRWNHEVLNDSLCYRSGERSIVVHVPKDFSISQGWAATHRPLGIFLAYGPPIKPESTIMNSAIYDIAPTLLYLQGHPILKDMDGKVLTDIFNEDYLARHPIHQVEPSEVKGQTLPITLDEEETRKIEERLRGLGYIE
jgi:predicted AlkP superfamily phosphohydrolase/phosphomutase